jgi:2-C-methyl-D-erythritol 4-phosphate cytidylyltransferase/2-C-methyl-D-erythritol 2,4-cyclodiphosphate synthase
MTTTIALIVAAGRGLRAGGGLPKQYREIAGAATLRHTVEAFLTHPEITNVRVVIHPDDRTLYDSALAGLSVMEPAHGGATRQASVANGLESLIQDAPDHVLIHDGARPFTEPETISRVIAALADNDGAIAALPVSDTVKRAKGSSAIIDATVPREDLWRAQTPQGFHFKSILAAHRNAQGQELTDDAAVAEAAGLSVALVMGSPDNIKITTPVGFDLAERYMAQKCPQHSTNPETMAWETRTGTGFDVHRFAPGSFVTLCGVEVPHDQGLSGHSDADVGLHALTDALFGALCDGDIGQHFPPTDPQWKGASSDQFLIYAVERLRARGGRLLHLDVTLICERPKIGPHREAMTARIGDIVGLSTSRISVKATTTEELGFTGRGEGIAAQAAVTIELPRLSI